MFKALSHWWQRQLRSARATRSRRSRATCRPRLEALEERFVPSNWFVSNNADDVNLLGSLRWAVAQAQNGDTIYIMPTDSGAGRVITLTHGELYLNHDVTITSLGRYRPVIDGNHSSRDFEVARGTSVALDHLFIIDGNAKANNSLGNAGLDGDGGGILNEGSLTMDDCWVGNNGYTRLGGKDHTVKSGGGIYNNYHGTLNVTDSSVDLNFAGTGGGIYNARGTLSIMHTTMAENSATGGGGAISNALGQVTIDRNSTLWSNNAHVGGAIYSDGGDVTVEKSDLEKNTAIYGGAIMVTHGKMMVDQTTIQNNTAKKDGGGIYNELGQLHLVLATLSNNSANEDGGGIASRGGTVLIDYSQLTSNSAVRFGGGIFDHLSTMQIIGNSDLSYNNADYGGGIFNWKGDLWLAGSGVTGNFATHQGGGIFNAHGTVTVGGSFVAFNQASEGASIYNGGTVSDVKVGASLFQMNIPNNWIAGPGGYTDEGFNKFI